MLMRTTAGSASAFFQSFDQVRARTLERRINSHRHSRQDRQCDSEKEHWDRKLEACVWIEWKEIRTHPWHDRNKLPGQERTDPAGDCTDQQTFKNEKPNDASARGADRHSQG